MRPDSTPKPPEKCTRDWRPRRHQPAHYETANQLCDVFSQPLSNGERELLTTLLFAMARHMLAHEGAGQLAKYLYLAIGNAWQFYRDGSNDAGDDVDRETVNHHVRILYAMAVVMNDPAQNSHRQYSDRSIVGEVDQLLRNCKSNAAACARVVDITAWRYQSDHGSRSRQELE